ncbi:ATP-binding protein [Streptomyces roseifaciens]|uniref:ATP-binding protein n=1 Tax=Streptomyces roseifaciens TaxID=1488406 RepID=UPI000717FFAE|nr:ATP-binding protein [Streptomyces roseifaciens]
MDIKRCRPVELWQVPFLAVPERVDQLCRTLQGPLKLWGLPDLVGPAQLCMAELVTNVITHVGVGTPTWVTVSLEGACVRIEVRDPGPHRLAPQEQRRGRSLAEKLAVRWGVASQDHGKTSWCELATGLPATEAHPADLRVVGAEAVLTLYGRGPAWGRAHSPLHRAASEEAATDLIVDLLHWLRAHGTDPDTALDRAQTRYEAGAAQGVRLTDD